VNGFIQKVQRCIQAHQLAEPKTHIVVAASGGPDSTALVHALHALRHPLTLVYVDHQTRPETKQEGEFVHELAHAVGAQFQLQRVELDSHSEASMRDARYQALETVQGERVATGHTASDQAETVLMRILRGTGTTGLAGIPPRRGRIIRPLIGLTRTEIMAFLETINATFCTDPTNADLGPLRNRVRHELLPLLSASYQANITDRLVEMANTLRRDRQFLENAAYKHIQKHGLNRKALLQSHVDLRPHIVRAACPVSISAERMLAIERMLEGAGGTIQLEGNVHVILSSSNPDIEFLQIAPSTDSGELDGEQKES